MAAEWNATAHNLFLRLPFLTALATEQTTNKGEVDVPVLLKLQVDKAQSTVRVFITDMAEVWYESLPERVIYARIHDGLPQESQVESFSPSQSKAEQVAALITELEEAFGLVEGGKRLSEKGKDKDLVASLERHQYGIHLTIETSSLQFKFTCDAIVDQGPEVLKTHLIVPLLGLCAAVQPCVEEDELTAMIDSNADLTKSTKHQQLKRSFGNPAFSTAIQRWQDVFTGHAKTACAVVPDRSRKLSQRPRRSTPSANGEPSSKPASKKGPAKRLSDESHEDEPPAKAAKKARETPSPPKTTFGKSILDASRRQTMDLPKGRQYQWNEEETQYPGPRKSDPKGKGRAVEPIVEEAPAAADDSATDEEAAETEPVTRQKSPLAPIKRSDSETEEEGDPPPPAPAPPKPASPPPVVQKKPKPPPKEVATESKEQQAAAEARRHKTMLSKIAQAANAPKGGKKKKTF